MAEEFQAGICSENWWNTARNESSPCTTAITDIGSFGWSNEMGGDMKCVTRSSDESVSSNSIMMGFGLSLPTLDWNQSLFGRNNGTTEQNFNTMLEQDLQPRSNFDQESHGMESVPIQKEWSPKNYSDRSEDSFSQLNQVALALDGHRNGLNSSKSCFPIGPSTTLLPSLFESDPQPQSQEHPYETTPMSYQMNLNEVSPWEKFPQFIKSASQKQQQNSNLHFAKNTPFWSASAGVMNNVGSTFSPSPQTQIPSSSFGEKPKCTSLAVKLNTEEVRKPGLKRGSTQEPTFKRPRIETPSPLPTFKVRKEKLGDRITALQQLVSPFGKTDTASVLYEAIEYIKFLHDQVHVLSTSYMKNEAHIQHQQSSDKAKDNEGLKQDLRNRGLCLVPISSTFPVAESPADFWTPTFGGTYC